MCAKCRPVVRSSRRPAVQHQLHPASLHESWRWRRGSVPRTMRAIFRLPIAVVPVIKVSPMSPAPLLAAACLIMKSNASRCHRLRGVPESRMHVSLLSNHRRISSTPGAAAQKLNCGSIDKVAVARSPTAYTRQAPSHSSARPNCCARIDRFPQTEWAREALAHERR